MRPGEPRAPQVGVVVSGDSTLPPHLPGWQPDLHAARRPGAPPPRGGVSAPSDPPRARLLPLTGPTHMAMRLLAAPCSSRQTQQHRHPAHRVARRDRRDSQVNNCDVHPHRE